MSGTSLELKFGCVLSFVTIRSCVTIRPCFAHLRICACGRVHECVSACVCVRAFVSVLSCPRLPSCVHSTRSCYWCSCVQAYWFVRVHSFVRAWSLYRIRSCVCVRSYSLVHAQRTVSCVRIRVIACIFVRTRVRRKNSEVHVAACVYNNSCTRIEGRVFGYMRSSCRCAAVMYFVRMTYVISAYYLGLVGCLRLILYCRSIP